MYSTLSFAVLVTGLLAYGQEPPDVPSWWPREYTFLPNTSCYPVQPPIKLKNVTAGSCERCLKECQDSTGCHAFTFESIHSQCLLFEACAIGANIDPSLQLNLTSGSMKVPPLAPMPVMCDNSGRSDLGNWSRVFNDNAELVKSPWGKYFDLVYGKVPDDAFPLCTSEFTYLDHLAAEKSGIMDSLGKVKMLTNVSVFETDFEHLSLGSPYVITLGRYNDGLWIHRTKSFHNSDDLGLAHDNQWIEVRHQAGGDTGEEVGMWLSYARGSGIWFNVGRTAVFADHASASRQLCGTQFPDDGLVACARRAGNVDSLQFNYNWELGEANFELVAVHYIGKYSCGTERGGVLADFRSGWQASQACNCDTNYRDKYEQNYLNCKGRLESSSELVV